LVWKLGIYFYLTGRFDLYVFCEKKLTFFLDDERVLNSLARRNMIVIYLTEKGAICSTFAMDHAGWRSSWSYKMAHYNEPGAEMLWCMALLIMVTRSIVASLYVVG
jgi:hypothetical protein